MRVLDIITFTFSWPSLPKFIRTSQVFLFRTIISSFVCRWCLTRLGHRLQPSALMIDVSYWNHVGISMCSPISMDASASSASICTRRCSVAPTSYSQLLLLPWRCTHLSAAQLRCTTTWCGRRSPRAKSIPMRAPSIEHGGVMRKKESKTCVRDLFLLFLRLCNHVDPEKLHRSG